MCVTAAPVCVCVCVCVCGARSRSNCGTLPTTKVSSNQLPASPSTSGNFGPIRWLLLPRAGTGCAWRERVCVCVERESVCVRERERERACVCERERVCVCVCVWRERVCVCVWRERERDHRLTATDCVHNSESVLTQTDVSLTMNSSSKIDICFISVLDFGAAVLQKPKSRHLPIQTRTNDSVEKKKRKKEREKKKTKKNAKPNYSGS